MQHGWNYMIICFSTIWDLVEVACFGGCAPKAPSPCLEAMAQTSDCTYSLVSLIYWHWQHWTRPELCNIWDFNIELIEPPFFLTHVNMWWVDMSKNRHRHAATLRCHPSFHSLSSLSKTMKVEHFAHSCIPINYLIIAHISHIYFLMRVQNFWPILLSFLCSFKDHFATPLLNLIATALGNGYLILLCNIKHAGTWSILRSETKADLLVSQSCLPIMWWCHYDLYHYHRRWKLTDKRPCLQQGN
jgi:hypothetical protein